MGTTSRALSGDENLIVLQRLTPRLPESGEVDLDELLGLAEYLLPVRCTGDFDFEGSSDEIEALIEWAEGDPQTLRRAWMLAVHRCGTHDLRRGAVELLSTSLHAAEERACLARTERPRRPAPAPTRPRVTSRAAPSAARR